MQGTKSWRVIRDNGNEMEVEVDQIGRWVLGPFKGTFNVKLIVNQNIRHRTVSEALHCAALLWQSFYANQSNPLTSGVLCGPDFFVD